MNELVMEYQLKREVFDTCEKAKELSKNSSIIYPVIMKLMFVYEKIKEFEEQCILLHDSTEEDLRFFVSVLPEFKKAYTIIIRGIKERGIASDMEKDLGFTVEDLEAISAEIEQLHFCLSNPMLEERRKEIERVFVSAQ